MTENVEKQDNLFEEEDFIETVIPPSDIFAFNESRSCADLKRMHDKGQLDISPDFQRELVWSLPAQTRFIDSLLKNLPIPSMCISLDSNSQQRIVIDGLQRISTIIKFLSAVESEADYQLSAIDDVDPRLSGKTIKEIKDNTPNVISAIENVSIPVTVLRCNLSQKNLMKYIFTIFHRLNTGGTKLNNQEIRNCIFSGKLNTCLFDCVKDSEKILEKLLGTKNTRFSYEEFILRFFAFQDNADNYKGRLVTFLNEYMEDNRNPSDLFISEKKQLFQKTIELFSSKITLTEPISKAILESILYGVAKNFNFLSSENTINLEEKYKILLENNAFNTENLQSGLLQLAKVKARLMVSSEIFSS